MVPRPEVPTEASALDFLAVFWWFSGTLFVHGYVLIAIAYVALPSTLFWTCLLLYALHVFSGPEHSLRCEWRRFTDSFVTRAPLRYFDANILGGDQLDSVKGERVLLGIHPHGVYPIGGVLMYAGASPLLQRHPWLRIRPCSASVLFRVPLVREYLLWTGHLDASRRTVSRHMKRAADDIALCPGGEKEALATRNGQERVLLLGRAGFVRLACMHGYQLVPTYAFGQNELFTVNTTLLASARAALQRHLKVSQPRARDEICVTAR